MPRPAHRWFGCFGLILLALFCGCGGNSGSTAPQGDPLGPATALAEKEALDFAASRSSREGGYRTVIRPIASVF